MFLRALTCVLGILFTTIFCQAAFPLPPEPEASPATVRLESLIKTISTYQSAGHFDSSLVVMREAFRLANSQNLDRYYADLYNYLGYYYKAHNKVDKAISLYKTAYYWCVKNRQTDKANWLTYRLASVYVDRCLISQNPENFKIALRQINKNVSLPKARQTPYNLVCNYGLLAYIYKTYRNDSLYYHYTAKTIAIAKTQASTPKSRFYTLVDEFGLNLWKGEVEQANEKFREVLAMNETGDFAYVYSMYLIEMLNEYLNNNYVKEAEVNALRILHNASIMRSLSESDRMNFYYCMAKVNIHINDFRQARTNHEKCKSYIRKELFTWVNIRILKNELALLEYEKKIQAALALQKSISELENNRNRSQAIFELAANEERLQGENVAQKLSDQLKIKQLEIAQKESTLEANRRIGLATFSIIVILILVILFIGCQIRKINGQSKELRVLNQQQNTLFGIISHDLRSPVADLQTFLSMINGTEDQLQFNTLLPQLEFRVNTLYGTLDNLLNWSLVQMGGLQIGLSKIGLPECVENVRELLKPQTESKSITILLNLEDSRDVRANQPVLEIIIRNLLHNAIKFTPCQGFIRLSSWQDGGFHVLSIRDSGNGFPASVLALDHDSVQSSPGTDGESGTGLGLKLCRGLIGKLNGELHLSNDPQGGAEVQVWLPKGQKNNDSVVQDRAKIEV